MSELKPCPFCGSTDVHTSPNGENYAYVYCNTCGAEGPTNDIGSVAMTWNRRAQPAQAVPSDVLHTFLDAAAGEGLVLGGVDAADLYIKLFPERYAAAIAAQGAKT